MAERLYYSDSFLQTFDTTVSDIREHSRKDGTSIWHIALDQTAFYPTSGGQPHDIGTLTATSPSGAVLTLPVLQVEEDESGEVWHATHKPLPAGTRVTGAIDWSRRLDHMQQHSGQHLLSAICARECNAATVSFHLGADASTIDLAVGALSEDQLARVQELANSAIAENLPVHSRTATALEAKQLLVDGLLRKLPEREGPMRLIEISGIDLNACGGTHVQALGQIGGITLRGTERVRSNVRLSFACGLRAMRLARQDDRLLAQLAASLSVQRESLAEALERKAAEAKLLAKERQKLREELADYHASRLLVEDPIVEGKRVVVRKFADRDAAYVKLLASRLVSAAPQTIALLISTEQAPASLVFARSADLAAVHCGELLTVALAAEALRGGGSPTMAQGQAPAALLDRIVDGLLLQVKATSSAPMLS